MADCFVFLTFKLYPNFCHLVFIVLHPMSGLFSFVLFSMCALTCHSSYVEVTEHFALVCPPPHQMHSGFPTQFTRPGQAW